MDILTIRNSLSFLHCKKLATIGSGHENSCFLVETQDNKKFVLKIFPLKDLGELVFEKSILEELSKSTKGYIEPFGEILQFEDEIFILYKYFDGDPLSPVDIKKKTLKKIAHMQANMHKTLQNFNPEGKRERFSIFDLSFIDLFSRKEEDPEIEDVIHLAKEKIASYISKYKNINLPKSIIHEDLELVNILQNSKQELLFIDFGESHFAPVISDIAIAIKELIINTQGLDTNLIETYIKAYQDKFPILTEQQLDMLNFLILRRTLFMFTYLLHIGHKINSPKNKGISCNIDIEYKALLELLNNSFKLSNNLL